MDRAYETGDDVLAKAALRRGNELQSEHLVGAYLEKYPDERPKWDEFTAAAGKSNKLESLGDSLALGEAAPEPPSANGQDAHSEPGV